MRAFRYTADLQITQNLESVCRVCAVRTRSYKLLPFPTKPKGRLKPIFRRPFATLQSKIPATISPNVARTSKLPIFQQLLGNQPCPVSTRLACSCPISPNAACCILSWAKFVPSAKLPQGVINKCNLYSNAKGRLKIPCGIFRRPFISGIDYLINQARHPLFSLYSAYWVPKRFCRPLCRWRSYLCPDSPDGAGSSGCS